MASPDLVGSRMNGLWAGPRKLGPIALIVWTSMMPSVTKVGRSAGPGRNFATALPYIGYSAVPQEIAPVVAQKCLACVHGSPPVARWPLAATSKAILLLFSRWSRRKCSFLRSWEVRQLLQGCGAMKSSHLGNGVSDCGVGFR